MKNIWHLSIFLVVCMLFQPVLAVDTPFADSIQEARAQNIFREIRCVVCVSETIAESHAEVASDMRAGIRRQMEDGMSDNDIKLAMAAQYGDGILMDPPFKTATFLLWLGPWIILFTGAMGAYFYFRKAQKTS